jgi:hypothetical protein
MRTCPSCGMRTSAWTADLISGRCKACDARTRSGAGTPKGNMMWLAPLAVLLAVLARPACSSYQRSQAVREKWMQDIPIKSVPFKNGLPGQGQ